MAKAAAAGRRRAATSPTWWPARWSARSRPRSRSPPQFGLPIARRRAADRERELLRGQAGRRRRRRAAGPAQLVGAARPVHARRGASPTRAIAARMFAALLAAREAGRGARGGLRLAPAADLDAAPARRAQAALARPAQARVRAGQPHQLPLRGHEDRRDRLHRAGRHLVAMSPTARRRQGRLMLRRSPAGSCRLRSAGRAAPVLPRTDAPCGQPADDRASSRPGGRARRARRAARTAPARYDLGQHKGRSS